MARRTLIKGGTIASVDPDVGDPRSGDVLIEDNRIVRVSPRIDGVANAETIDASDRLVMPGLIDTHRGLDVFNKISSRWRARRQAGADHDRRHPSEGASHRREPFKKGPVPRRIGRTKGGLNSKLHAVCDGHGRPLVMLLSEG
jgi:hypothetical protein